MKMLALCLRLCLLLIVVLVVTPGAAVAQELSDAGEAASGFRNAGWSFDTGAGRDQMRQAFSGGNVESFRGMTRSAQSRIDAVQAAATSGGGGMTASLGITPQYQLGGIGGYFLSTIFGSELIATVVEGQSSAGPGNSLMGYIMKFATYIGVAVAIVLGLGHAITMFTSYMEYGDMFGEAKDRFIGTTRAAITLLLISPVAAGGLAPAQYGAMWSTATSNGMGNRLAFVVAGKGFGDPVEGGSIFSMQGAASMDPNQVADSFTEMVGAQSCRSTMGAMGTSETEIRSVCGRAVASGTGISTVTTTDADATAMTDSQIQNACEAMGEIQYQNVCISVRKRQRETQESIEQLYEKYDGDLSSEQALRELEALAERYARDINKSVQDINQTLCGDTSADCSNPVAEGLQTVGDTQTASGGQDYSIDTDVAANSVIGQEFQSMILRLGWPGLALIYSKVGERIDAVSELQANGTDSEGFSIRESIKNANQHMTRSVRQVQRDSSAAATAAQAAGSAEAERGIMADGWSAISNFFSDGMDDLSITANESMQGLLLWLFDPLFSKPATSATYEVGANVIGTLMAVAAAHDFLVNLPVAGDVASGVVEKVAGIFSTPDELPTGEGSIILYVLMAGLGLLVMFILMMSAFLVFVVPKLPLLIVGILLAEWAVWCAIVTFGATIWVAINLSALTNTPHLATMAFLRGIGVILYILLYPTLIVIAVVVSVIIYNLLVPTVSMLMISSFGMGFVDSVMGIFIMPIVMLFGITVAAFLAITAIARIPDMINGMLGIQSPGQAVSGMMNSYIGGPQQYNTMANPAQSIQSVMTKS